ncbi:MAG: hypothetical protein RLZZ269_1210 [Actinomycetota bacterium]
MTVHGFVLAGGLSRRMGIDKATVERNGRPIVVGAVEALSGCDHVTVLHRRPESLKSLFGSDVIECMSDDGGGQGPLDGLRTALHHSTSELTVILAVDLVESSRDLIDRLIGALRPEDVVSAAIGRSGQRQGLVSVWRTPAVRPIVDAWFERGERSVHRLLETIDVRWVEVDDRSLRNVNAPSDLAEE